MKEPNLNDSMPLVEDLVSISLECIVYLRNIFDENNFMDSIFMGNSLTKSSVKTKRLIRGVSRHADTFLDWIGKGLLPLLRQKYVKAFQLMIYLDQTNPHDLVESYLFEVNDRNEVTLDVNHGSIRSDLVSTREKVQYLIKRLIVLTQTFPTLPPEKYVSLRMLYSDSCPASFHPPFFHDATLHLIPKITLGNGDNIGSLETGSGTIDIQVLSSIGIGLNTRHNVDPFYGFHSDETDLECNFEIDFPRHLSSNGKESYKSITFLSPQVGKLRANFVSPYTAQRELTAIDEIHHADFNQSTLDPNFGCESGCGFNLCHCITCERLINPVCYGNRSNDLSVSFSCYTCMFEKLDPLLIMLMRIRFLWHRMMEMDHVPTIQTMFEILKMQRNHVNDCLMRDLLNKLFQDNILMIMKEPCFKNDTSGHVAGSGVLQPTIDGLFAKIGQLQAGTLLEKTKEYYILFVPKAKQELKNLSYNQKMNPVYFPNYSAGRKAKFKANLEKFKQSFKA